MQRTLGDVSSSARDDRQSCMFIHATFSLNTIDTVRSPQLIEDSVAPDKLVEGAAFAEAAENYEEGKIRGSFPSFFRAFN